MKSVGFFVLWIVGSVVAVSVAFAGIAVVDDELVSPVAARPVAVPRADEARSGGQSQPTLNEADDAEVETDSGAVENLQRPSPQPPPPPDSPPTVRGSAAESSPSVTRPAEEVEDATTSTDSPGSATATASPQETPTVAAAGPVTAAPVVTPTPLVVAPPTSVAATPVPPIPVSPTPVPPTPVQPTPVPPTPIPPTPVPPTPIPPTPVPPTPVPPTPVPPTPVPPPTGTAVPPTAPVVTAQVLTFNLIGGSTAISFAPTAITVLWASPNPGFEVEIKPEDTEMRVEFESDDHKSRIEAWWAGGPQHEIREEADD